ncbi:MAG: adenylate/guanylate cyclase domain-containing protein [Hyphomicrobiaceae bacterium]
MSESNQAASLSSAIPSNIAWERTARLWAGLILFAFVTTHLLNHAIGVFGVDAMQNVQVWRVAVWRSWAGSILLYGAVAVHIILVLKRTVLRRTWRMPLKEALQIALGLLIPVLIYQHLIGTRYMSEFGGTTDSYLAALNQLWPGKAFDQSLLVIVVWAHGVIGLHYLWRSKPWYPRVRDIGLIMAFAVPVMALAGFVSAGREAVEFDTDHLRWNEDQRAMFVAASRQANWILLVAAAALVTIIAGLAFYRRIGGSVILRYTGHGDVKMARGLSVLEASRSNSIPHPSLCGGRGRCSTCRVLVLKGIETLDPPDAAERALLNRISAPGRVRLACRIRPKRDISVQIVLPVTSNSGQLDWNDEALKTGVEQAATVLFVDLRGFDRLTQTQLPFDLVVLLNRFVEEMRQAIEGHGGRVTMFLTDGIMAVFGQSGPRAGAKAAITAAQDMLKSTDILNTEFESALPQPLRVGIGIHTGPIVMARVGDEEHGFMTTALGETVTLASRLESATKELLSDCLVSQATLQTAGLPIPTTEHREINLINRAEPLIAYPLASTITATEAPVFASEDVNEEVAEA